MRAALAALAAGLLLVAVGCGNQSTPSSSGLGSDAAALAPPGAIAFVSIDGNLDSKQWQRLDDLTKGLPLRDRVLEQVRTALRQAQLDFDADVRPAVGPELGVAVLQGDGGSPEPVVLTQPEDESKLRSLVATYDEHAEGYRVERIGDWSVVADSTEIFRQVRAAESGRSLADVPWFQQAHARVSGKAVARAYANGTALSVLPAQLRGLVTGSPRWVAARLAVEDDAIRVELDAASVPSAPALYRPSLLRDVPSGAVLAVSFKDLDRSLGKLGTFGRMFGLLPERLAPALKGEGAFYVLSGVLIPNFALEVQSPDPDGAANALRAVAATLRAKTGNALPLRVARYGSRVVLTNAPATLRAAGGSLMNDHAFKDALAKAGVPDRVTFLAYADLERLAPIVKLLAQLGGGSSARGLQDIDRLKALVAFGAGSDSASRIVVRVGVR